MIDGLGGHGTDQADAVEDRSNVWEQLADLGFGFSKPLEGKTWAVTDEFLALELGDLFSARERFRHGLPMHFAELRFGIEGFQMGRSAGHGEPDDAFGPGREVGGGDHAGPAIRSGGSEDIGLEQGSEGEGADALGSASKECPAGLLLPVELAEFVGGIHERVMVSWRLRMARAMSVQAAKIGRAHV